jgi:hypothetical protein
MQHNTALQKSKEKVKSEKLVTRLKEKMKITERMIEAAK